MDIIESEMTPLTIDGRETIGGVMCVEIQTYQLVSDSSWTTQMPTYHYEWVTTATYCSSGGAGGNSWTGGDNVGTTVSSNPSNGGYPQQGGYPPSTGGGSGPVINNGPPINTSPIPIDDVVEIEDTTTPCEKLKQLSDNQEFIDKINFLKPYTNSGIEYGVEVKRKIQFDNSMGYNFDVVTNNSNNSVILGYSKSYVGSCHNHPIKGHSIPSWGDVLWLKDCDKYANDDNKDYAFSILVVKNTQSSTPPCYIYAIKVEDFALLEQKLASDIAQDPKIAALTDEDKQTKAMNDKIGKKNLPFLNNTVGLEKRFLEEFYSHGISLYKLDESTNNWSKLQLASPYNPITPNASNSVVPIPCNN